MAEIFIPNLLLVAGVGRNSGKTTFICEIIRKFHSAHNIIAIKISPHFHNENNHYQSLISGNNFSIYEETRLNTGKDSSRFLTAGAQKVYYLQVNDDSLEAAWKAFSDRLDSTSAIVCEGAGLREIVKPGLFVHCNFHNTNKIKDSAKALIDIADFKAIGDFSVMISRVSFENNSFIYRVI